MCVAIYATNKHGGGVGGGGCGDDGGGGGVVVVGEGVGVVVEVKAYLQ